MLKDVLKVIRRTEILITSFLFVAALVVLTLNVIFRRVSMFPALNWAEEFMRYCSIWITFVGMSLCAEDDLHIGVDIVYQMSPVKRRKVLKIISMAAACVFCALFSVACIRYVAMALNNMQRSPVMQVPLWIVYMALPIGSILSTFQYVLRLVFFLRVHPSELEDKAIEDPTSISLLDLN